MKKCCVLWVSLLTCACRAARTQCDVRFRRLISTFSSRSDRLYSLNTSGGLLTVQIFSASQLTTSFFTVIRSGIHAIQRMLMKAAVAVSLKLCLFTARVLLNTYSRQEASQSF